MKVRKQQIPKDQLAFDHKEYLVMISTHYQKILISIIKGGNSCVMNESMSPEEFISLLMTRQSDTQ